MIKVSKVRSTDANHVTKTFKDQSYRAVFTMDGELLSMDSNNQKIIDWAKTKGLA
jgi:hypothetical protein